MLLALPVNKRTKHFSVREALRRLRDVGGKILILQMAFDPPKQDVRHRRCVGRATLACSLNRLWKHRDCVRVHESLLQQTRIVGVKKMFNLLETQR